MDHITSIALRGTLLGVALFVVGFLGMVVESIWSLVFVSGIALAVLGGLTALASAVYRES